MYIYVIINKDNDLLAISLARSKEEIYNYIIEGKKQLDQTKLLIDALGAVEYVPSFKDVLKRHEHELAEAKFLHMYSNIDVKRFKAFARTLDKKELQPYTYVLSRIIAKVTPIQANFSYSITTIRPYKILFKLSQVIKALAMKVDTDINYDMNAGVLPLLFELKHRLEESTSLQSVFEEDPSTREAIFRYFKTVTKQISFAKFISEYNKKLSEGYNPTKAEKDFADIVLSNKDCRYAEALLRGDYKKSLARGAFFTDSEIKQTVGDFDVLKSEANRIFDGLYDNALEKYTEVEYIAALEC